MFTSPNKLFKGTFLYRPQKAWEINLENCLGSVLEDTGLSEEELYKIMEVLDDYRVIN